DRHLGEVLGYIGIAASDWQQLSAEADSVVRGGQRRPGLMSAALRALLAWGERELGLVAYSVRVLADNPALQFYEKFGFREMRRIPLMAERSVDGLVWREAKSVPGGGHPRELVYMVLPVGSQVRP